MHAYKEAPKAKKEIAHAQGKYYLTDFQVFNISQKSTFGKRLGNVFLYFPQFSLKIEAWRKEFSLNIRAFIIDRFDRTMQQF